MNNKNSRNKNENHWLPLSRLPAIAAHIDKGILIAEKQHQNIIERLQVFDKALVARIKKKYGEQLTLATLYSEQIERWKKEAVDEQVELVRLAAQCKRLQTLVTEILAKANQQKHHQTIEKVLAMHDAGLGSYSPLGEIKLAAAKISNKEKPPRPQALSALTLNQYFMQDFVESAAPCFALGLLEERGKVHGLLALRPVHDIPPELTAAEFGFAHCLHSYRDFELMQFLFEFYGFQSYNALINPNNLLAQMVLGTMIRTDDYFLLAMNPGGTVTTFRTKLEEDNQTGLKTYLPIIRKSKTANVQYWKELANFEKKQHPDCTLLNWVCWDDEEYLDLTENRLELIPEEV